MENVLVYVAALYDFILWVLFLAVAFGLRFVSLRMGIFRSRGFVNILSVLYVYALYGVILFELDGLARAIAELTGSLLISATATLLLMTSIDYFQAEK